jgi:phage/plasmid-associated DNA primase
MVNDAELDYKRSQDNVCTFVASRLDGQKYESTILPQVFDDARFKVEMYLFNVWLKMHEPHLDEAFMDFAEWMEMYEGWTSLDEVKEYRTKLLESGTDPQVPTCGTAQ